MARSDYDEKQLPQVKALREFIAVIDSHDVTKSHDYVYGCSIVTWGLRPFWGSQMVTVGLWTGVPDADWIPPCINDSHERWGPPPTALGDDGFQRECNSMESFWEDMGKEIGLLEHRKQACSIVRIVNATAIIEYYVNDDTEEHSKRRIRSIQTIASAIQEGAMSALEGKEWRGQVKFLSMNEWVALGEWEDVFTRTEMAPFLSIGVAAPDES